MRVASDALGRGFLVAVALLVALAACSGDDSQSATVDAEAEPGTTQASPETTHPPLETTEPASTTTEAPPELHDYPHLTGASTFEEVANHPAFEGFGPYMDLQEAGEGVEITRKVSIEVIGQVRDSWDTQTMLDGLNFMIDQINAGQQLWYPLYSEEEIAEDPTKATAGMFFIPGDPDKPLAVVAPGGGFAAVVSIQEGFPHAVALHELGFNVAILKYRIEPDGPEDRDVALERTIADLTRALTLVEENADVWGVGLDDYSVWGSSAGGAIVSVWGTDGPLGAEANGFEKPAVVITAYPLPLFEASPSYPPTYVVMAADDDSIAIAEVDAAVEALRAAGVEVEFNRLDSGGHGFGLGVDHPAEGWFDEAVAFWRSHTGTG